MAKSTKVAPKKTVKATGAAKKTKPVAQTKKVAEIKEAIAAPAAAELNVSNPASDADRLADVKMVHTAIKRSIVVTPPPAKKPTKDDFLRADPIVAANNLLATLQVLRKETANEYDIAAIADDGPGYGARLRVLKVLRGGPMVVTKDAEPARLKKELYELVGARTAGAFALKCEALLTEAEKMSKLALKEFNAKKKADIAQREADIKRTAWQREVHDGKPILDAPKKLNKKQEAADQVQFKAALAARVRKAELEESETVIAAPKPDAKVNLNLDEVCVLEDPNNGIVLLRLEKPNSQGAICVYNNGSRVAAGVVPTEVLNSLRSLASTDLVRDVNQLLHPMTAGVVVTSVAERHLTALLVQCKESINMGNETVTTAKTKKFAPPSKGVTKKEVSTKAEKPGAAKTEKADKAPAKKRASVSDETTIKLLTKEENPYREGTKASNSFELLKKSKTFGEYVKATEKSKADVYEALYFAKWASAPHGKAPAYIKLG